MTETKNIFNLSSAPLLPDLRRDAELYAYFLANGNRKVLTPQEVIVSGCCKDECFVYLSLFVFSNLI